MGLTLMIAGSRMIASKPGAGSVPSGSVPSRRWRVLLVDHHPLLLRVLERFMSSFSEIDVVAITTSSRQVMALVALHEPDVVVISVTMPELSGTEVARQLACRPQAPKVILTALDDDPVYQHAARAAGASGFVSKLDLGSQIFPMIKSLF